MSIVNRESLFAHMGFLVDADPAGLGGGTAWVQTDNECEIAIDANAVVARHRGSDYELATFGKKAVKVTGKMIVRVQTETIGTGTPVVTVIGDAIGYFQYALANKAEITGAAITDAFNVEGEWIVESLKLTGSDPGFQEYSFAMRNARAMTFQSRETTPDSVNVDVPDDWRT
jgi:hypothetical protein